MSKSAIFTLLSSDNNYDKMFTATDLLKQSLANITTKREEGGYFNPLPTVADIEKTHLIYVQQIYKPFVLITSEYLKITPPGGAYLTDGTNRLEFNLPSTHINFINDIVFHVQLPELKAPDGVLYKYTPYPGIRMFEDTAFVSDGNLIDNYTYSDILFKNKFEVTEDMRACWDRAYGQQTLKHAECYNSNGFTNVMAYKDGLQTLKNVHPATEMWVPAQFWFCNDVGQALVGDLMPKSQKAIRVVLSKLSNLIMAKTEAGIKVDLEFSRLNIKVDMYINTLYTIPEIYNIFASRIGYTLIRVHKQHRERLETGHNMFKLDQLKFATEYIYMGVRQPGLMTAINEEIFDNWHLFGKKNPRTVDKALSGPRIFWNDTYKLFEIAVGIYDETDTVSNVIDSFSLFTNDIELTPATTPSFFNTYLPMRYFNNTFIVSPKDTSVWLVPFCLYPGMYNPSGYVNLSKIRDLTLTYKSSQITAFSQAELVCSISAINFLVRKGDSMVLRFNL